MLDKAALKHLISSGKTAEALDGLLEQTKDTPLYNRVVEQKAKWQAHESDKFAGMQSGQELEAQLSRLNRSVLKLIDDAFDPDRDAAEQASSNETVASAEAPVSNDKKRGWWDYVVAAGVIVAILGGMAEFLNYINIVPNRGTLEAGKSVSVLAHAKEGKDKLVLPGRGIVELHYGEAKIEEPLNQQGEATFQEIPERFFKPGAKVEMFFTDPEGEPYRVSYPDSLYTLVPGQKIALQVELQGMDKLEGVVKDFVTGEPLASVQIRIRGESFYSNEFGEFTIEIPEDRQKQFIDISAFKEGYQRWELSNVPTTTEQEMVIGLKPE